MDDETIAEKLKSFKQGWNECLAYMGRKPLKSNNYIPLIEGVFEQYYQMDFKSLSRKKRMAEIVFPRQLAMFFLWKYTHLTLREIGIIFGRRDHTTVIHSRDTIFDLSNQEPYAQEILFVESMVTNAMQTESIENINPKVIVKKVYSYDKKHETPIQRIFIQLPPDKVIERPEAEYSNMGHINLVKKYGN